MPPSSHVTLLSRGASRWWLVLAAVVFVVLAFGAVRLWQVSHGDPGATAEEFLSATSCEELRELSGEEARAELDEETCAGLVDAANGLRTYADPGIRTGLDPQLSVIRETTDGDDAEVVVRVDFDGVVPAEEVTVRLDWEDGEWHVHDWSVRP